MAIIYCNIYQVLHNDHEYRVQQIAHATFYNSYKFTLDQTTSDLELKVSELFQMQ